MDPQLRAMLDSIQEGVKRSNEKLDRVEQDNKELKQTMEKVQDDINEYKRKCVKLSEENKKLIERVNTCERNMDYLMNKDRAKNVIIYKVPDTDNENKDLIMTTKNIIGKVNTEIPNESIVEVKRLGKQKGSRPIMVTFSNPIWKTKIFADKNALGSTNYGFSYDLTREEREKRRDNYKILTNYKNILLEKGKTATIKGSKLLLMIE